MKTFFNILIGTMLLVCLALFSGCGEKNGASDLVSPSEPAGTSQTPSSADTQPSPTATDSRQQNIKEIQAETERNEKLEAAILRQIDFPGKEDIEATRYYYNKIDLNDDGRDEVFVELIGPYTSGTGGDTGLLFSESNGDFNLLQRFTLITNPIIVSDTGTNGWHDLILTQAGGGEPPRQVRLIYDGTKYPNPNKGELIPKDTTISGTAIIFNDIAADFQADKGLYLNAVQTGLTEEDQAQFETALRAFALKIEQKDIPSAEKYCTRDFSDYLQNLVNGSCAVSDNFSLALTKGYTLKLTELKGFYETDTGEPDYNISKDKPTVDYKLTFVYTDADSNKNTASGYVKGVKGDDGAYLISGFASGL